MKEKFFILNEKTEDEKKIKKEKRKKEEINKCEAYKCLKVIKKIEYY